MDGMHCLLSHQGPLVVVVERVDEEIFHLYRKAKL
jgi:hypothetical protein